MIGIVIISNSGCSIEDGSSDLEISDWTTDTHSNDADPNFDEVFEDNTVKRIDIVIMEEYWQSMLDNMTSMYGEFGSGGIEPPPPTSKVIEDPIFVPAEIFYNGIEWYKVGVRFKGNSSLRSSWTGGILKLSFKLNFDKYEDDYPQINDQRFYGFKELSLKNNFKDLSMLREKVAGDIFLDAGLAGAHTAFYTVFVDHGEGPVYFGLYTMCEEIDDTVIDTQFSDNCGNLYKPEEEAATFAAGSYNETEYGKKTNEEESDFSDIQDFLTALHNDTRITDPPLWRKNLESVFDTYVFLKYLAVNTVIQNWDTYGKMTHNYFLYNNPASNELTWIPWDNNEALQDVENGGTLPLDFSGMDFFRWPVIGFLYMDPVYRSQYNNFVRETVEGVFSINRMQSLYSEYSSLIEPYATSEIEGYTFLNSTADFYRTVSELNLHVVERAAAVEQYLSKQ